MRRSFRESWTKDDFAFLTPLALEVAGIQLEGVIGRGEHSIVKAGKNHKGESIAVKAVNKHKMTREILQKFLPREIDIMANLKHPNIIEMYFATESESCIFMVLEYASQGSLLDEIIRKSRIPEQQARRWFVQLASAISYCHDRGIAHRDIKCDNLLLTKSLVLKVSDFGYARKQMRLQGPLSKTFCGSVGYTSPEILMHVPYIPHFADIWAMGVVLFAMVYGKLPFTEEACKRLASQKQCRVRFPPTPAISANCKSLINKIIAPLPHRAYFPDIHKHDWIIQGPSIDQKLTNTKLEDKLLLKVKSDLKTTENGKATTTKISTAKNTES